MREEQKQMGKNKEVAVVLSTYNGEKYVHELLKSIIHQKGIDVQIFIRDDGSTDSTVHIVKEICKSYNNVHLVCGENKGYAMSFLTMLKSIKGYEYYAFADQDDIWLANKLSVAVRHLEEMGEPNKDALCYWCNLTLVDEKLNIIKNMKAAMNSDFEKGRYLIDKYGYGCTMVFSAALKKKATNMLPSISVSHDNWVGLCGVFLGRIYYDIEPFILYRQHRDNVVGGNNGLIGTWKRRFKSIRQIHNLSRADIAAELLKLHSAELSEEDIRLLKIVAEYRTSVSNKLKFFFNQETKRASVEKNILFRLCILVSLA